jgi:CRP/FNR family transcriptional regulator, cyclic AMP receptor protein
MPKDNENSFDLVAFIGHAGIGRRILQLKPGTALFSQGDKADAVFYIQKGRAKLTVVSESGKQATITLLGAGDFVGEESVTAILSLHLAAATAITACTVVEITRTEMIRMLRAEPLFSLYFLNYVLSRSLRTQADLVDQLFNSTEKRLARILLLMADFGEPGEPHMLIPKISQEALGNIIGATRSKVSFFMNRFRKLGLIEYNDRILVKRALLHVLLHDGLPERNAQTPDFSMHPKARSAAMDRSKAKTTTTDT